MTLTYLLFSIAPLVVAPPLTFTLLPPLLPFPVPRRCFRTCVLTTYQFFYLSLSLRSFASTSVPLPSTFRKLAGMTLLSTLILTVLLQRNARLSLFSTAALYLSGTECGQIFLSAASNTLLKPGGLLRWKVRSVKDARRSRPLTEVMKIARPTSPLLDAPRQSSQRPRLRHGRRLAILFHLNLTLNLYTLFFDLSLALLPHLPPPLSVLLPGNQLLSMPLT